MIEIIRKKDTRLKPRGTYKSSSNDQGTKHATRRKALPSICAKGCGIYRSSIRIETVIAGLRQ